MKMNVNCSNLLQSQRYLTLLQYNIHKKRERSKTLKKVEIKLDVFLLFFFFGNLGCLLISSGN